MIAYSKNLSSSYDELMGDYSDLIVLTKKLVIEFAPKKDHPSLLELGCGTGNVLQAMPEKFSLSGLDNSEEMLKIAEQKVARATYYLMDMSSFKVPKKFDIIISPFEPFNHLLQFSQWQQTFQLISSHLEEKGVFIFDVNTPKRHKALCTLPAHIEKKYNKLTVTKVLHMRKNIYAVRFQIFTKLHTKNISLLEENVFEASFSVAKIKKTLEKYFFIKKIIDPSRPKVTKESGRVVFICEKKITTKK